MAQINWLSVGQAGMLRLDIPVYTLGTGKPVFGITCYVHGNESGGVYIVSRVIDHLRSVKKFNGTIHIIPVANPAAQLINSRVSPFDQMDLNRLGYGKSNGSSTERISARLFEFLTQCDLVVNIHEFEMHTPTTAVFMNGGSAEVKKKTLRAIQALSPDIIWVIDYAQTDDVQYQVSLDTALAQAGVANFPIETRQLAFLTEAEINKMAEGLLCVAALIGIVDLPPKNNLPLAPAFMRQEIRAENFGLWEPIGKLMQVIKVNDLVGTLRTVPEFEKHSIISPNSGILIQHRHRQIVMTGTSIFTIGHEADKEIAAYI